MIYPITDRLLPTINNAEFKRYAMRYLILRDKHSKLLLNMGLVLNLLFHSKVR